METVFVARLFAYAILPLLLATIHLLLDPHARTPARRIELFVIYLLSVSVGAAGLGGAFGHWFLADLVATSIGWPTGSPFQAEMGFANLALGVLGIMAAGQRGGFRLATVVAVSIIGAGATLVHLQDIAMHGNLAPGNTIQNISNLLDPVLLIALLWRASQLNDADSDSPAFQQWRERQLPIAGCAAAGIGIGFGIGFALDSTSAWTLAGALIGAGIGKMFSLTMPSSRILVTRE